MSINPFEETALEEALRIKGTRWCRGSRRRDDRTRGLAAVLDAIHHTRNAQLRIIQADDYHADVIVELSGLVEQRDLQSFGVGQHPFESARGALAKLHAPPRGRQMSPFPHVLRGAQQNSANQSGIRTFCRQQPNSPSSVFPSGCGDLNTAATDRPASVKSARLEVRSFGRDGRAEAHTLPAAIRTRGAVAPAYSHTIWQDIAVPAAEGLLNHALRGNPRVTIERFGQALSRLIAIGGSHAQRDLLEQI
jgi:hypothetical protein